MAVAAAANATSAADVADNGDDDDDDDVVADLDTAATITILSWKC